MRRRISTHIKRRNINKLQVDLNESHKAWVVKHRGRRESLVLTFQMRLRVFISDCAIQIWTTIGAILLFIFSFVFIFPRRGAGYVQYATGYA